jgi:hypothetical protein
VYGKRVISYLDDVLDVVPLQFARDYLNAARTDEDMQIESFIGAAIARCSNYCGFSLRRATTEYYYSRCWDMEIPANIISVTSVSYQSAKDTWTALSADDYYLNKKPHIPCLTIINEPSDFYDYDPAFKVVVQEGFYVDTGGSTADQEDIIPYEAKQAILLTMSHLYGNRSDVGIMQTYSLTQGAEFYLHAIQKLRIL